MAPVANVRGGSSVHVPLTRTDTTWVAGRVYKALLLQ